MQSKFEGVFKIWMLALLGLLVVLASVWLSGCNDHRFTPVASIEVYPDVIDYEVQRKEQFLEQVLITNKAVSANLEIYETAFEDSVGTPLTDEEEIVFDQGNLMSQLQETRRRDGKAITYASFVGGVVSDVTCVDDSYCNCDPENDEGGCQFAIDDNMVQKEQLGNSFVCADHPLDPESEKVCLAYFKYFNNAGAHNDSPGDVEGIDRGKTQVAIWGGQEEFTCSENTDCARLGPEYTCMATGVCGSDIKIRFSLEYALEQLVSVDNSIVNTDQAATWSTISSRELCLIDETGKMTSGVTFYGLNRCDQMALKQNIMAMDDGDVSTSYRLYPKRQANFRLMSSPVDIGQSRYVAYCDNGEAVVPDDMVLADKVSIGESCLTGDGAIKTELTSVSPDSVKLDQLPLRVLYAPDQDYPAAAVLVGKSFTMRLLNSARVGGSNERTVSITVPENRGGPPIPIIEIPEDQQNPEPLTYIHLDGRNSTSPFGEERKPFQYKWEWAPNGRPAFAQDAILIESTGSFDNPVPIMGKWTSEGYPKIFFPIAGNYCFRMYVKDSAGVESGPNSDCSTCPKYDEKCVDVKPSQKLHVELIWDRGDYVDLDLFLVRYRDDGTFAVPSAFTDRLKPDPPVMGTCDTDADCYGGAFSCEGGICRNSCASDDDCHAVNGGWFCNDSNQCDVTASREIECDSDAECDGGYCVPRYTASGTKTICTKHDFESVNDTCFFTNGNPRWGAYGDVSTSCSSDAICNGVNESYFSCVSSTCDYTCENSNQCISASEQYLCGDNGTCVGNSVEDDPTLDIDDVDGWGPENISLEEPVTGTYRLIARLYADQRDVVSSATPNSPVTAFVQIYINGELKLPKGIAHEFTETSTYWKIADVEWTREGTGDDAGDGEIVPICAGWTKASCNTDEECGSWYTDKFTCEARSWGKYCSTCTTGSGAPEECNPTIPCDTGDDCTGEATSKICAEITGNYCRCAGVNEFGNFEDDPYANPFIKKTGSGIFDPASLTEPRSIWCDEATDLYNVSDSCASLYGN